MSTKKKHYKPKSKQTVTRQVTTDVSIYHAIDPRIIYVYA